MKDEILPIPTPIAIVLRPFQLQVLFLMKRRRQLRISKSAMQNEANFALEKGKKRTEVVQKELLLSEPNERNKEIVKLKLQKKHIIIKEAAEEAEYPNVPGLKGYQIKGKNVMKKLMGKVKTGKMPALYKSKEGKPEVDNDIILATNDEKTVTREKVEGKKPRGISKRT